jgi:hypothetical protein
MASSTRGISERPSARIVLLLGLLMTGSVQIRIVDSLPLALNLTWFLPLLAAWLTHHHGIAVLRAGWPLLVLPALGVSVDNGIGLSFGVSTSTLLLALIISAAIDTRLVIPSPKKWLRGDTALAAIAAFCMLVVAALEVGHWRVGDYRVNPLAVPPTLIFLLAIRWETLGGVVWPGRSRRMIGARSIMVAALMLTGWVFAGVLDIGPISVRFGSVSLATLVPILCFAAVVHGLAGPRAIASMLFAGLLTDRLLVLTLGESLGPVTLAAEWQRLSWDGLLGSLAATLAGQVLRPFLRHVARNPPGERRVGQLMLAWIAMLLLTPLLTRYDVPSHGSALWLVAAISFVAGAQWRERSLVFVPPLLMFLWLLAATITPAGSAGFSVGALATFGLVSFPFAFCGAFLAISRQLAPLHPDGARANRLSAGNAVNVVDLSQLVGTVERIDRSATWRSFLVAAAPFVVLWQFIELYGFERLVAHATGRFGADTMIEEWHYAVAALLAFAPLAFAFWDWLDRQDRLRMLALVSGSLFGALAWQVFGGVLGVGVAEVFGDLREEPLGIAALLAFPVLLSGSGLIAGTDRRVARPLFLTLSGLALSGILAGFVWLWKEDGAEPQLILEMVAELGAAALLAYALSRFIHLRLLLAGDRPRELLFGALLNKGFWVRMGAASGLPSSAWRSRSVADPALWALLSARFVVYTGGVLAQSRTLAGAVLIVFGHLLFHAGKRLIAREMWRPRSLPAADRPILFLRGFDDDQCAFRRPPWRLLARWLDLWSFRQNLDEALVDELAQFGPVIALGRPGDKRTPFGAQRHYSDHADWQQTLAAAARSAQAIVLVASDSPGVKWEYELLKNEAMLDKVLLIFRPDAAHSAANRHAADWFYPGAGAVIDDVVASRLHPVSLRLAGGVPVLGAAQAANAASGVLSLRVHLRDVRAKGLHRLIQP